MYKNRTALNVLLALWQLPQVILGVIMLAIFRNKKEYTNPVNGITVWNISHHGAFGTACFSTGPIILTNDHSAERTLRHETGHSKQSIYLGWLFHIVVSIPSVCRFWIRRWMNRSIEWYHSGYPENWADRLGGVDVACAEENNTVTDENENENETETGKDTVTGKDTCTQDSPETEQ